MLKPSGLFRFVDIVVWKLDNLESGHEQAFADQRKSVRNIQHTLHDMSIIDGKSSTLLTHVSIMLAVIAILVTQAPIGIWRFLMTCELVAFRVVGMVLLRCVDIVGVVRKNLGRPNSGEIWTTTQSRRHGIAEPPTAFLIEYDCRDNEPVSFSRHCHHRPASLGDVARFVSAAVRSHTHLAAENLFLRKKAVGVVRRAPGEAPTCRRRDADDTGRPVVAGRLASNRHHRAAGHAPEMASPGLSVVLALEIATARATSPAG